MKAFENTRPMLRAMTPDRVQWAIIGLLGVGLCLHDLGRTVHWVGWFHVTSLFVVCGGGVILGGILALTLLVDLIALPKVLYATIKGRKRRRRDEAMRQWLEANWEHPMRPELVREYQEKVGSEP